MIDEIKPTIQNQDLLRQFIDMKIKEAMKERYPGAEEILEARE